MPTIKPPNLEEKFNLLTDSIISNIKTFFKHNPIAIKRLRRESTFPYSFIAANHQKIFAISRNTLGTGSTGKVKIGKEINTGEIVAIKTILFNIDSVVDYHRHTWEKECAAEVATLKELGQLYTTTARWWLNRVGTPLKPNSTDGWENKHKKIPGAPTRYNLKFYIFVVFFDGVPVFKYFKQNNPKIKEILNILIIILEELKKLHLINIVHGDFSFNNILIRQLSNKKIKVSIIDFGCSGKLQNGVKKYSLLDYRFDGIYVPPECDRLEAYGSIIPELEASNAFKDELIDTLKNFVIEGYGFYTVSSDLYSLGWCVYFCTDEPERSILLEIFGDVCEPNPYYRPTLDAVINRCKLKLLSLEEDIIQDLSSLFREINLDEFNDRQSLGNPRELLINYSAKTSLLRSEESSSTVSSFNSSNELSSCNTSSEDLNSLSITAVKFTPR